MVVVDKPSGLLVHRSPIDRHETRFALQIVRDQLGQRVYPVHRLDKPTSGALVMALDSASARMLAEAFATGAVSKTYQAIVRGWPPVTGSIDRPLAAVEDERIGAQSRSRARRRRTSGDSRRSSCRCESTAMPTSRYALVELQPRTGRRHQLRRHLAGAVVPDRRRFDLWQGPSQPAVRCNLRRESPAAGLYAPRIRAHSARDAPARRLRPWPLTSPRCWTGCNATTPRRSPEFQPTPCWRNHARHCCQPSAASFGR